MKLKKKLFLKALEVAVSVAKNRATMPILYFLRLEGCDGTLKIHATDLDSHVVSSCECEGSLIPVCAPANLLHGLAKSAGDEINLTMEKDRLKFESNGSARLSTLPAVDMPEFPSKGLEAIGLPCADLADGLDAVSWCCSKESAVDGAKVAHVFVKVEPKAIVCLASNGKQLAYFSRGVICATTEFIIPSVYSDLISSALRLEGAVLKVSPNQVVVISDTLSVSTKRWDGPFFSVKNILEAPRKPAGEIELAPLRSALEAAYMVGTDSSRFAKVYLLPVGGRTRVQCQSEVNVYLTWLPFSMPERINVNAALAIESLSRFKEERVKMGISSGALIMESGDLLVGTALCIKDKDVLDPEMDAINDAPPGVDEPPTLEPTKVINPDDYAEVKVNF